MSNTLRALLGSPPPLDACPSLEAPSFLHPRWPASPLCSTHTRHSETADHMTQLTEARARLKASAGLQWWLSALPPPRGPAGAEGDTITCEGPREELPRITGKSTPASFCGFFPARGRPGRDRETQVSPYGQLARCRRGSVCSASQALVTLCRETHGRDLAPLKKVSQLDKRVEEEQFLVLPSGRAIGRGLTKPPDRVTKDCRPQLPLSSPRVQAAIPWARVSAHCHRGMKTEGTGRGQNRELVLRGHPWYPLDDLSPLLPLQRGTISPHSHPHATKATKGSKLSRATRLKPTSLPSPPRQGQGITLLFLPFALITIFPLKERMAKTMPSSSDVIP